MRPTPREALESAGLPALLLSNLTNIRYLTGLNLSAGLLLVTARSFILFVDARYTEAAEQDAREGIGVRSLDDLENVMKRIERCGFEEDDVSVARFRRWKTAFPRTTFVRSSGVIEEFRRSKDDRELSCIRRARKITIELLRRVPAALRARTTEKALAWKLQQWARELGADGLAFDPIVAFGSHSSRPHHRPTLRVLQRGSVVKIDVGAMYRGYCADLTQVFFAGKPTAIHQKVYRAVEEARDAAIDAIREGVSTAEPDRAAKAVLKKHGIDEAYWYPHALGHGVGLEVHEGVTLSSSKKRARTFLKGEVVAVEPGVYIPGKFGIRLEDTIVVE
jgi:Xaa-Pro aminopeptidase/Xaa-Pro dipeptidase